MTRASRLALAVCALIGLAGRADALPLPTGGAPPGASSAEESLYDVVVTAIVGDGTAIVMGALGRPQSVLGLGRTPQWRFRLLRINAAMRATHFTLSGDGTKAVIRLRDRTVHIVDLARPVLQIPQRPTAAPSRYLAEWLLHAGADGELQLTKDVAPLQAGVVTAETAECVRDISSMTQLADNTVWVAGANDTICHGAIDVNGSLHLVAGPPSMDPSLTLVHRGVDARLVSLVPGRFALIDPATRARQELAASATRTEALLLAASRLPDGSNERGAFARLARELDAQASQYVAENRLIGSTLGTWAVWTLRPNATLYAPSLELAQNEPVLPASIDVWDRIDQETHTAVSDPRSLGWHERTAAAFAAYRRLELDQCSIYTVTRSYAGSWLHQYWIYYPFDIGQGSHFHDTEHVFVEVDKLGGTIYQVIGAAHGVWAPNNVYRTDSANVSPVTLPLHAIVEFGKHASAPDINRDLKFTIGIDVNTYRDRAKIWGIRDTTALTDANLRGYDGTMVLDRRPEDVWYPDSFQTYFPTGRLPSTATLPSAQARQCRLLPFPAVSAQPCTDRHMNASLSKEYGPSTECAAAVLNNDGDYKTPTRALKRAYAPLHTLRYSIGKRPQRTEEGALGPSQWVHAFGGVGDISWLTFIPEPMRAPGRLSLDVYFAGDFFKPAAFNRLDGFQVRYERLSTNLAGVYLGMSLMKDAEREARDDKWFGGHYRSWLDFGSIFEFAPLLHVNVGVQAGLSYTNGAGLGFDFRVVGALLREGTFGIRKKAASPY